MTRFRYSLAYLAFKYIVPFTVFNIIGNANGNYFIGYLRDTCLCTSRPLCIAGNSSFTLRPLDGVSAGYILLSRDAAVNLFSNYGTEYRCAYTIVAPPAMAVFVRINAVNIPLASSSGIGSAVALRGTGGGCKVAALQIYDGNSTNDVSKQLIGMCGSALPTEVVFLSTSRELTLFYHESADVEEEPTSFNLTFTYVAARRNGCSLKEFSCRSNFHCVSSSLLCDGVENCPDGSDESSDFDSCGRFMPASNPFVGTTVGVSLFLFFGLLLCVAAAKVKKRRHLGNNTAVTLRGATSSDSARIACLPDNNPSDNNLFSSTNQRRPVHSASDDTVVSASESRVIPYPGQNHTFQPLILVAGSRHVTVVAVAPPSCQEPTRCTPPPAYDSLFPETSPPSGQIS